MAKYKLSLSAKADSSGRKELYVRATINRELRIRFRTGISIREDFFNEEENSIIPPRRGKLNFIDVDEATKAKQGIEDFITRLDVVCKSLESKEELTKESIEEAMSVVSSMEVKDISYYSICIERGKNVRHYSSKTKSKQHTFYDLVEEYISRRQLADSHARVFRVLSRAVSRYEGFVRETDKERKNFTFDIHTITKADLEDIRDYFRNEKLLSDEYPTLFNKLIENYPPSVKAGNSKLQDRGDNTVIKMMSRLKSLFRFFVEIEATENRPFEGLKIGTAVVGSPIYISIEERNKIAEFDIEKKWEELPSTEKKSLRMSLKTLKEQRDIFIFHCYIGCRVGDLTNLSHKNIDKGVLIYTPHKTKDDGDESVQARVPLHDNAKELIKHYNGMDKKGRLFPFISDQRYNDAIKVIFKLAGITRMVEIRNSLTGENELVPINEIASSHMARRTFVGNAYLKVQDPNLIGKMSGHVEGSRAFKRYRKIEDETLKNIIDLIG